MIAAPATLSERRSRIGRTAFTLPEMMITMAIFSLMAMVGIYTHIFGLRMTELMQTGVGTDAQTRAFLERMTEEIRTSHRVLLGSGTPSTFTEIDPFRWQFGSAVKIFPTANTNVHVYYWLDTSTDQFKRSASGESTTIGVGGIKNELIFTSEDHSGSSIPNHRNNRAIGLNLEFYKLDGSGAAIGGSGALYNTFTLQLKVTRRMLQ